MGERRVLHRYAAGRHRTVRGSVRPLPLRILRRLRYARSYLDNNPDLKDAFGYDYEKALNHWWQNGIGEGRRASAEFDVSFYLHHHSDLVAAFGVDNFREALDHWIEFGKAEGRTPVV